MHGARFRGCCSRFLRRIKSRNAYSVRATHIHLRLSREDFSVDMHATIPLVCTTLILARVLNGIVHITDVEHARGVPDAHEKHQVPGQLFHYEGTLKKQKR